MSSQDDKVRERESKLEEALAAVRDLRSENDLLRAGVVDRRPESGDTPARDPMPLPPVFATRTISCSGRPTEAPPAWLFTRFPGFPQHKKEGHQRNYYAPGVGTIKVGPAGGVSDPEELELTSATKLCKADFEALQALTLAEDARAYSSSKNLWSGYPPAKVTLTPQLCS